MMKRALILLFLMFTFTSVWSKWVEGYIQTKDSVRIVGEIKLPKTDFYTGGWFIKGFDLSYLYYAVKFRGPDNKSHIYYPDELKSFSFKFKGEDHFFISETLHYKSIIKIDRQKDRFLNVIYSGALMLCRNELQLDEERIEAKIIVYEDYYLYNSQLGLTKLEVSNNYQSLNEILKQYGMSEVYLETISHKISLRNITEVLFDYDQWLINNKDNFQVVI